MVVGMVDDPADVHEEGARVAKEDPLQRERRLSLFDGMLEKVPARDLVRQLETRPDLSDHFVFFDRNHLFRFASALAHLPLAGHFPTEEDYLLEHRREDAKEFVRRHYPKLDVGDVRRFAKVADARAFLKDTDGLWVLKSGSDRGATFLPDVDDAGLAAKQILQQLEAHRASYEHGGFILEPLISSVVELTPERLYYDGVPVATTLDIENKPFGAGNVSIQTGCAQDLVFPIPDGEKICEIAFPPIVEQLARRRKGLFFWDASLLIDRRSRRIYFGEFCSNRPGFNSLFSEIAQCRSAHDYFSALARKENPFTLGTVACSVTLFNPATDREHRCLPPEGAPIEFKPRAAPHLWLWDVKKVRGKLVSAGHDWNLGVATGSGKSIEDAVREAYRSVDDFSFVGAYYRPRFDYLSSDYPTSIVNRLNYGLQRGLYPLPFHVQVGNLS